MVGKYISDLNSIGTVQEADELEIQRTSSPTQTRKTTVGEVADAIGDRYQPVENGFVDPADSEFSIDNGTRTFTVQPKAPATEFVFYSGGTKYTKTSAQSVVFTDTEGMWFFYFDTSGTLVATQTFSDEIITTYSFISLAYWDTSESKYITLAEERHGNVMDSVTHLFNHNTIGTRYGSGLQVADITADGSGNDAVSAQISVGSGTIWDEDIKIDIAADARPSNIPILYRTGSGDWNKVAATDYMVHTTGTGRAAWNEESGGTWSLTEVGNNDFMCMHLYATNDIENSYFWIMGQADYATIISAREGAGNELLALELDGLPVVEYKSVASFIIQTSNTYTNAVKSRVRTTDTGDQYIDWRFIDVGAVLNINDAGSSVALLDVYPVGAVYISVDSTDPSTLFGGTWAAFGAGRVLVGFDSGDTDFDSAEETGGSKDHTLTEAELPPHTHNADHNHTASSNSTGAHTHDTGHNASGTALGSGTYLRAGATNDTPTGYVSTDSDGAHSHTITVNTTPMNTGSTGSGSAHNNLQPYITVYMWKRTA